MGSISILLADDSITIQKVVGIIFGSDDYTLTIVDNGKAALQKAQELLPDVMLIDALMPGMNGYEVCEAIRKDAALAAKPVLLLTGSFEPFDEDKARQCGADDHIIKPFESQQIVAKVLELYQLGINRTSGVLSSSDVIVQPVPSDFEPLVPEEPFVVEHTAHDSADNTESSAIAEPALAFLQESEAEDESAVPFVAQAVEPEPLRTPDDPWGAFTQQPVVPVVESETEQAAFEVAQPDVMAMLNEETSELVVEKSHHDDNIGASWVPVEEQTFEFREEIAVVPPEVFAVVQETVEEETVFVPTGLEVVSAVKPIIDELTVESPVTAPALTEEQLKEVLLSSSKETIERIVWEVVPDLAEAMIKEAIKRITEAK